MIGSYQTLAPVNRLYFRYQPFPLGISDLLGIPDLLGWETQMSHCPLCCAFVLLPKAQRLLVGWFYYIGFPSHGDCWGLQIRIVFPHPCFMQWIPIKSGGEWEHSPQSKDGDLPDPRLFVFSVDRGKRFPESFAKIACLF